MPGPYAQRFREMIKNTEHRTVLEFWANDVDLTFGDQMTMAYLNGRPGNFTACHNVASTLVDRLGAGGLTMLDSSRGDDFAPAVGLVRNGGCVMEVKFRNDHSVCVISRGGETHVEVLEAWAGAGVENNSADPYCFIRSVFEDHEDRRPTRGAAADAIAQAAAGNNLANSVGLLTRCQAGACGINGPNWKLTVKYRLLDNINTFRIAAQQSITMTTERLSEITYRTSMPVGTGVRCRVCFKKKPSWRILQGWWHHCATCQQVFCDACGALRPRPPGHGYGGSDWTRHRRCTANHTMTMF